ncbi:MAG: FG-GAP repeat protein [Spirochaetales bacterium]|nr:FG-GAP repeat protein [Spirochaetales bacterium]
MKRCFVYVPVILFQILFYCCSLQNGDDPPVQPPPEGAEKITAADAEEHDYFGSAVSVEGDIALVGANGDSGGGIRGGAAYIFYRSRDEEGNWKQIKKLTASDAEDGDGFGNSVGMSGKHIIIGAERKRGSHNFQGAAYIFSRE